MRRLLTLSVLTIVTFAGAPPRADAQVYPERIRAVSRNRVVAYQRRDDREEQVERYTKTVKIGANGEMDVSNIAGDITVTRGNGSDATIEVVKTARDRTVEDAKSMLQMVQVDINERAGRVEIRTQYPNGDSMHRNGRRNFNVAVAFNITAPAGTRITAKSISGGVKVTDIKGEVGAESVSGDVAISGSARVATAKSVSGNVDVSDVQMDGTLEAGSVSGDVVLRRLSARRIDTSSISGEVKIDDVKCERIDAQSISGTVSFGGPLARNGRYSLKSHSGEVRVAIAAGSGFEVEASSFSGEVRSDIPITTHGTTSDRGRKRLLTGTYGDGSAVLELTTFSGSILITKR
jgi:DUF4097 and DUF4098 domain-containing protein YvlB